MGSSGTKISCHAKISLGSFQYWPKWWRYIKFVNLRWWASQFHGFFILILIPLNQYIFSVFLIKLTNFGGLLCLNGGSNGPEINFSGHVIDGLRADGLFVNLRWWASQFHGFFILILIPLNQYIFSVFLIKLTNFGGLLCLNGGSNGPEINFSGHVIDGLRADGLWPNKDNLMSQETSTKTREHTHTHLANLIEITLLA